VAPTADLQRLTHDDRDARARPAAWRVLTHGVVINVNDEVVSSRSRLRQDRQVRQNQRRAARKHESIRRARTPAKGANGHRRAMPCSAAPARIVTQVTRYEHARSPILSTAETVIFCSAATAS
jgi:hypothetical protein